MPLRFEDPPPARRNIVDPFADDLEELRQHPNRWAVIATHPHSEESKASAVAQAIRLGKTPACQPKGSFEAKQRRVGDEHRVYVRYVGKQENPDA